MKRLRLFTSPSFAVIAAAIMTAAGFRHDAAAQGFEVPFSLGRGWTGFEAHCAGCHGPDGGGTDQGPPLVHPYYVPSHHSDGAIVQAILYGAGQHHWRFGDMAPVAGISDADAERITAFIRWLQTEKGLLPE